MVGKTTKNTLVSGASTTLTTALSVDGGGSLRQLRIEKGLVSGAVVLSVKIDGDTIIDNQQTILGSGSSVPSVDLNLMAIAVSGATITSGLTTQPLNFVNNCTVQYSVSSGNVNIYGILDIQKRLIQS